MQVVINIPECPNYICTFLRTHEKALKKIISDTAKDHLNIFKTQIELNLNICVDILECLIVNQWNCLIHPNTALTYQSICLKFAEYIAQTEINIKLIQQAYSTILKALNKYIVAQKSQNNFDIIFYFHEAVTTDLINLVSVRQEADKLALIKQKEYIAHTIENGITNTLHEITQTITNVNVISDNLLDNSNTCLSATSYLDNTSQKLNMQTGELAEAIKQLTNNCKNMNENIVTYSCNTRENEKIINNATQDIQKLVFTTQTIQQSIKTLEVIAKQTDLLSLNANIEAARSGSTNDGFSVVAAEIKNLATQTATTNKTILSQISVIQNTTDKVVEAITGIGNVITSNINELLMKKMTDNLSINNEIHNILFNMQTTNNKLCDHLKAVASSASKIDIASKRLQTQTNLVKGKTQYFANLSEHLK